MIDKLINDHDELIKQLQDENKSLKAAIVDRDRQIHELVARYEDCQSEVNSLKCAAQRDRHQLEFAKGQHIINLQHILRVVSQHQDIEQIKKLCGSIDQCLEALQQQ